MKVLAPQSRIIVGVDEPDPPQWNSATVPSCQGFYPWAHASVPSASEPFAHDYYPYEVIPCEEGGFVIRFPDLPGCMTQVETPSEVGSMAEEIRTLWLHTESERGRAIPPPSDWAHP